MIEQNWEYSGSVWDFIDMVKWSLVAQHLAGEERDDMLEILKNPDNTERAAQELGITDRTLVEEMRRIGEKAEKLFLDFDKAEGKEVVDRPELFKSHRKPRDMREVFWLIDSK